MVEKDTMLKEHIKIIEPCVEHFVSISRLNASIVKLPEWNTIIEIFEYFREKIDNWPSILSQNGENKDIPTHAKLVQLVMYFQQNSTCSPLMWEIPDTFDISLIENDTLISSKANQCAFCSTVQTSKTGKFRCWWCNMQNSFSFGKKNQAIIFKCHMGLLEMIAPLWVGGNHIAKVNAGKVIESGKRISPKMLRDKFYGLKLENLGVSFEHFENEFHAVQKIPEDRLQNGKELLQDLSTSISQQLTSKATLAVINEVNKRTSTTFDIMKGLTSYLKFAHHLLYTQSSSIWLRDVDSPEYLYPIVRDWDIESGSGYKIQVPIGKGLVGSIAAQRKHHLCNSPAEIDAILPSIIDIRHVRKLKSFLGVPIFEENTLVGVFEVGTNAENAFHEDDIEILRTLAAHASSYLKACRIVETYTSIIAEVDSMQLAERLVELIPRCIHGNGCSLFLRKKPGTGPAYLVATRGLRKNLVVDNFFSNEPNLKDKAHYQEGEGLTGWVLQHGQTLRLPPHTATGERKAEIDRLNELKVNEKNHSLISWIHRYNEFHDNLPTGTAVTNNPSQAPWLGFPLLTNQGLIYGVLRIAGKWEGEFNDDDIKILETCTGRIYEVIKEHLENVSSQDMLFNVVKALARAIDEKDPYTECHSQNVQDYSRRIAEKMGISRELLKKLQIAALLHDIGKIGIPDIILSKPGPLNRAEKCAIQFHPEAGYQILESINNLDDEIKQAVYQHHERINGKGYPKGISGEKMGVLAKILAVADSFDAIQAKRPYKPSKSPSEAYKLIISEKDIYDENVLKAFKDEFKWVLGNSRN